MTPPPELTALLDAYGAATGLILKLSYERERVLSDLHSRGVTPSDITAVLGELQRLLRAGTKGYCETSLDFRNALGNPDVFEERMVRLRQRELRKRKPVVPVATERKEDLVNVVNFLDVPPAKDVPPIDLKSSLINLANNIRSA